MNIGIQLSKSCKRLFGSGRTLVCASAPGRLDVMGGIADYSGSLVLQMPIKQCTSVILALRDDGVVNIHSELAEKTEMNSDVQFELNQFSVIQQGNDYSTIRTMLAETPGTEWAAYVLGCLLVLNNEKEAGIKGADVWIESEVPIGKGVSSSAAIEVSTMMALCAAAGIELEREELPLLCQKVENLIVGAPCGIMDQLASYLGQEKRLLPILCQPHTVFPALEIPQNVSFVGIDSGVRHTVSGASYGDVRIAAFMGYSIIAQNIGTTTEDLKSACKSRNYKALPYSGFLANIPPSMFATQFRKLLPEGLSGKEFIERYKLTHDPVTTIHPDDVYAIQNCAAHPVYENFRVQDFALLLEALNRDSIPRTEKKKYLEMLGELMYQSHASYSLCGLGNTFTDELVESVRTAGPDAGLYGAKITGGGSGGTVCVLCEGRRGVAAAKSIADENAKKHGIKTIVFDGSGDGALQRGVQSIKL